MGYKPKAPAVMAAPNVIPMADIMLVLLIIFMVITPMLQKGVSVDMAKVKNPQDLPDADKDDAVIIAVTRDGNIYLGSSPRSSSTKSPPRSGTSSPIASIRRSTSALTPAPSLATSSRPWTKFAPRAWTKSDCSRKRSHQENARRLLLLPLTGLRASAFTRRFLSRSKGVFQWEFHLVAKVRCPNRTSFR